MGGLSGAAAHPATVPPWRRWAADPLVLLVLLALGSAALAVGAVGGDDPRWWPPALAGVVAAGLALSGST